MIRFSDDWLTSQFEGHIKRGVIIKFKPDDLDGPKNSGQSKLAIVLNGVCPAPKILYVFSTSQHAFYDRNRQYEQALIRVPAGTYEFLNKDTIFPFRNVRAVCIERLHAQYKSNKLTFCGTLSDEHIRQMDEIITAGLFIHPRIKPQILP